jgi:PhzF family phenazine biosynthesis protein
MQLFQVDAFTNQLFHGNPAAVVPLDAWPDDDLLRRIAAENNLSETAFLVPSREADYHLRWFTPTNEVNLCGHATLASAWVLFHRLDFPYNRIHFTTASGPLEVMREGDLVSMALPCWPPVSVDPYPGLLEALGLDGARAVLEARDTLVVLDDEAGVRAVAPDFRALKALDLFAVTVTAPGDDADAVYRFFAPSQGVDEDPVTGSACSSLVPYWRERLGREELELHQLSPRGGQLFCRYGPERIEVRGRAVCYLEGRIES